MRITSMMRAACVLLILAGAPAGFCNDYYVTDSGLDTNSGNAGSPFRTITHALSVATLAGDVVHVGVGSYRTATGETFPLLIRSGVSLRGAGADMTTIAGDRDHRILQCDPIITAAVVISDFLIAQGKHAPASPSDHAEGGAIRCSGNEKLLVIIQNNVFNGNVAQGAPGNGSQSTGGRAYGGAVNGSNLWLMNNAFINNQAFGGGGAPSTMKQGGTGGEAFGGAVYCLGHCVMENNSFYSNTALGGVGGPGPTTGRGGAGVGGGAFAQGEIANNVFEISYAYGGVGSPQGDGYASALSGPDGSWISHNLFWNSFANGTIDHGLTGSLPLFADPLSFGAFGFAFDSPVKDAGIFTAHVGVDLLHRPRPVVPSLGAAEPLPRPRGDFDRDGKSDVLWRNNVMGRSRIWFMNGATVSSAPDTSPQPSSLEVAGTGDFSGDGIEDILWRNPATGDYSVWIMASYFTLDSRAIGTANPATYSLVGIGDFNRDGRDDILFRDSSTNDFSFWLMNSGGTSFTAQNLTGPGAGWAVAGIGDFDGDRQSDILLRSSTTHAVKAWMIDYGHLNREQPYVYPGNPGPEMTLIAIGDFDRDGRSDLLWSNSLTRVNFMWFLDGEKVRFGGPFQTPAASWSIAAVGDFNGDHAADLFWRNTSGANAVWLLNFGSNSLSTLTTTTETDFNWLVAGPR